MKKDMEQLERACEELLASLNQDLPVRPDPAVVARVRTAVRCALDERWLAGQPQPAPGAAVMDRVAGAVRGELARVVRGRRRVVALRRWLAVGSAVAAAVVLIVGLARLSLTDRPKTMFASLAADQLAIERFIQVADNVWVEDPLTSDMRDDIEAIEESLTGFSVPTGLDPADLNSLGSPSDGSVGGSPAGILSDAGLRRTGVVG
ncbi:MAG TPA: hypothetical protein VLM89_08460 [Phycisphaerae bacterium]|nr:hypothetical protein [Phycisphaerae bacterium]